MSPKLATVEVAIGTDSDERTRVEPRGGVGAVKAGSLPLVVAATVLGVSYRQAKRLWRRFKRGGAAALRHRQAGRASNRGMAAATRRRVLALIRQKLQRRCDDAVWADAGRR